MVFCSPGLLVDLEAGGEGNSGGGITLMQWKTEASPQVPQPILPHGQTVKTKSKERDTWFAGVVTDLLMDGTYGEGPTEAWRRSRNFFPEAWGSIRNFRREA